MPRGKNYVNNNRGVTLQASNKKNRQTVMQECSYGAACTRKDCIYRHPTKATEQGNNEKVADVCLPFLAGQCTFGNKCRKRHVYNPTEKERLLAKYRRTKCRFGEDCRTEYCLYQHPWDEPEPNHVAPIYTTYPTATTGFPGASSMPLPPRANNNDPYSWTVLPGTRNVPPPAVQQQSLTAASAEAPSWTPQQQYATSNNNPFPATNLWGAPPAYNASLSSSWNVQAKEFVFGGGATSQTPSTAAVKPPPNKDDSHE